ncbi:Uncharacterised protein [Mycobacteroides abscessus subsp. abscessus]|nr:Uncharacterised protein [Mycobacteroides abscessus subsp. abscessus]
MGIGSFHLINRLLIVDCLDERYSFGEFHSFVVFITLMNATFFAVAHSTPTNKKTVNTSSFSECVYSFFLF